MSPETALATIREHAGPELAERLQDLDRVRAVGSEDQPLDAPDEDASVDADVVFLGGGLSLLVAAELARLGARVLVLDRARVGSAHREWNASAAELVPLVEAGIVDPQELRRLVVRRYRHGVCAFHGGVPRTVTGVLDHAVDAGALLDKVRAVALARGARLVDRAQVVGLGCGRRSVRVGFLEDSDRNEVVGRIVVDARGASSPYATTDLVCPTVGGVIRGLDHDPSVGEILVTTEHASAGRQHVWEGFPGRQGELTVYLFYYARTRDLDAGGALLPLYGRFFDTLASYKPGVPELVRPTFGYIPGWSRLTPAPRGPSPRVVLVGDAAARHSPLTFCGFGSMLRTFRDVAAAIASALPRRREPPAPLLPDEPVHAWTGLLARMMASRSLDGASLNRLLDDAFAALEEMGPEVFAGLLKDRLDGDQFVRFLWRTSKRHPAVYREVMTALGPRLATMWGTRIAWSALAGAP